MHFAPFFSYQRTIYSISEDGYLMMTIARNIALGLGMSTAGGTIPTNGTQPLMTFIMSLIYIIVQGDKITAIKIIIILEWITALLGVFVIYNLGKKILKERSYAGEVSLLTAMIWYVSPNTYIHTLNALETGLFGVAVMAASGYFVINKDKENYKYFLKAGIIFGILFWLRNDAIFFVISAVTLFYLYHKSSDNNIRNKIILSLLISALLAAPWLIYNYIRFNSIMPVSGSAEMVNSHAGGNIIVFPSVIIEYLSLILPVPYNVHMSIPFFILCILAIIFIIIVIKKSWAKIILHEREIILFYALALCMFIIFYGLFFETYYFVPRYLFPFSAFLIALPLVFLYNFPKLIQSKIYSASQVLFFIMLLGILYVRYNEANAHSHYHMADWVGKNVKQVEWVGAFQSGTIGYFHDRTINLDGKVNPDALKALKEDKIYYYIAGIKPDYLVNWQSTSMLEQFESIKNNYNLIVNDTSGNLSVFKRKQ